MESYAIIKQLAAELYEAEAKLTQALADRERYLGWWLEEQKKREELEAKEVEA